MRWFGNIKPHEIENLLIEIEARPLYVGLPQDIPGMKSAQLVHLGYIGLYHQVDGEIPPGYRRIAS